MPGFFAMRGGGIFGAILNAAVLNNAIIKK